MLLLSKEAESGDKEQVFLKPYISVIAGSCTLKPSNIQIVKMMLRIFFKILLNDY